jgi:hypothetical protein
MEQRLHSNIRKKKATPAPAKALTIYGFGVLSEKIPQKQAGETKI